jgi:hypothetical protein
VFYLLSCFVTPRWRDGCKTYEKIQEEASRLEVKKARSSARAEKAAKAAPPKEPKWGGKFGRVTKKERLRRQQQSLLSIAARRGRSRSRSPDSEKGLTQRRGRSRSPDREKGLTAADRRAAGAHAAEIRALAHATGVTVTVTSKSG